MTLSPIDEHEHNFDNEAAIDQPTVSSPSVPTINSLASRPKPSREERLELERERLVASLSSGNTDHLTERIAWLLSRFPETRDSDITLQLRYWAIFEPELYAELEVDPQAMYRLTRLTSITRARAKIQNSFRLFQASHEIRQRRGRLSEEARDRNAVSTPPSPVLTVYADESGKTGSHLIVGSVWFLDPRDTLTLWNRIQTWRRETKFEEEFHFSELSNRTAPYYHAFVDLVLAGSPLISFKSISVSRTGVRHADIALEQLFFELLKQGVAHEHDTGRAELPRRLLMIKDREEEGSDRILLSRLAERLTHASSLHFEDRLKVRSLESVDSRSQPLLQLADLYTSSLNRTFARSASNPTNPKDVFADFFLDRIAALAGATTDAVLSGEADGDLHIHLRL